jgi:hypothetical protein
MLNKIAGLAPAICFSPISPETPAIPPPLLTQM